MIFHVVNGFFSVVFIILIFRWNLSKDEMDQFEELVEPHQNTIDTTAKARQQLYDDVFKAYNAYAPRLFVAVVSIK